MNKRLTICLLISAVIATTAGAQEQPEAAPDLRQLAREAFASADHDRARQHLQALAARYRQDFAANRGAGVYVWSQRLCEIAREYLRAGFLPDAMKSLGEAADLNLSVEDKTDDGLGSAAAGLHRHLVGLNADERYEVLREWSLPTDARRGIRVLTAMTPIDAPPTVFARALGERPRDSSFAVPEIGGVYGLFCSTWELVKAADEAGSLRRLMNELTRLTDDDVPNANFALTLARVVAARRQDAALINELSSFADLIDDSSAGSPYGMLRSHQQVWQYGYGRFDEESERTADFKLFPHWDGDTWDGGPEYPDKELGWTGLNANGGHPGARHDAIRRWIAPRDGTLLINGALRRTATAGNGLRGRVVSSRSGLVGNWIVRSGTVLTSIATIKVQRDDTLDFIVDAIEGENTDDSFSWRAQLAFRSGDGSRLSFDSAVGFHGPRESIADVVVGAACLQHEWLQPIGERVLKTKLEQTYGPESLRMRPFLRYAHATALQHRYEDARKDILTNSDLELWAPASTKRVWPQPQGSVRPLWLSDQDHIMHAFGPRNDYLLFRYPLTGEFRFSCDTQIGGAGGTDGCVAYGGLGYEVWAARSLAKIFDASFQKIAEFGCPFVASNRIPTFNRFSLTSRTDGATFSANGHPTWVDPLKYLTSPWIGLRSWGERVPIYRNFKIAGNPVIPREVKMSAGNSLRGWVADYYVESTPPPPGQAQAGFQGFFKRMMTSYDWSALGGVIQGARRAAPNEAISQSRLYYLRPLQDGESISYEFEYQPEQLEVHPALGRIAFVIEPTGVRLHWMTDGDQEWTGLSEDNSVVEPLNRRGPKPLPLMAGEWNGVTVELKRDILTLSLNDETIYTRQMEPENERTFGFYHDKNRSAVRVRNVVMRGDWPEQLTDQQLNNLAAVTEPDRSKTDRQLLGALFDDRHVHGSVLSVHKQAGELSAEKRYAFLSDWVLPNIDHDTLRMALDFTPTNPAPPAAPKFQPTSDASRMTAGGDLISPALDLVSVAKELGKLDELRGRVVAISVTDNAQQQRSQLAMLALTDIAVGNLAAAKQSLDKLAAMVADNGSFSFRDRWPETLAIWGAARHAETRDSVRDMAYQIEIEQTRKRRTSGNEGWDQQMRALASRVTYFDLLEREPTLRAAVPNNGVSPLANWVPASKETARTRGQGFPRSHWVMSAPATIENFASHHDDYLFFRIPLRGNYEVECDVTAFGFREANLWVAGRWVGPVYTYRHVDVGTFHDLQRLPLNPAIHKPDAWIRYRAVVRDGVCATYANGREIHKRRLDAEHDPWLAIRSFYNTNGAVRNLRITGNPEIPSEVRLTANTALPGWLPIGLGHRVGPNRKWRQLGGEANGGGIHGILWGSLPGSHWETLLRYHRPMVEDGTIEYEFFYREGSTHVHPALDRLAFMLQPDGVRVHWVTDRQFDRTTLGPGNLFDEPENRRGPEALPLRPNDWNRLQLALVGDTVGLKLNDKLIYERKLESTNQRTFGLFHYADRTEALVRNVVWKGDWPRELPSVAEQELAGEGTEFLDESAEELAAVFHHDFAEGGFAGEKFGLVIGQVSTIDAQSDGLHVTRPGGDGYNNSTIAPRLTIHGDFDITLAFDQFEPNPTLGGSSSLYLQAVLDSDKSNECLMARRYLHHRKTPQPVVQGSYVAREVGGARRSQFTAYVVEAIAGRMRLARRGETVYYLFAENDSPHFRLVGTQDAVTDDVRQLRLLCQAHLEGLTKVVWKSLTIRADKLSGLALQDEAAVLAELNKQRDELPQRFEHDFAKDPLSDNRFQQWGPLRPSDSTGLRMVHVGTDNWTSSGFNSLLGLRGDFDVAINFDEVTLGKPKEKLNSSFYLQIEFPDAAKTQTNVLVVEHIDGERQVYAQIRVVDAGGNNQYRQVRVDAAAEVEKLRLARRGKSVVFLYRRKGAEHDQVLGQRDILDLAVPQLNMRFMLHTGGAGVQSEVLLKQFSVRAERIEPNPSEPPASLPALGKQLTGDVPAHALEFDGRTQYVTIPTIRYDGSHPITLEAFVTPDQLQYCMLGDTQSGGLALSFSGEKYSLAANDGKRYERATADTLASRLLRVHLAGTIDGRTLKLFVNGKLASIGRLNGNFKASAFPMTIGASPSSNKAGIDLAFDGVIDQVRISNAIRYTEDFEVPVQFEADENTMASYRFDEGKGQTLADSSGNDNHGQLRGAIWVLGDVIRARAAQGLADAGRHGIPLLTEALANEDSGVQLHAIAALGSIGPDASPALPTLKKLASSSDPRVSKAASEAIALIETGGVLKSILNLFNSTK
jgi:hypothetical protein